VQEINLYLGVNFLSGTGENLANWPVRKKIQIAHTGKASLEN